MTIGVDGNEANVDRHVGVSVYTSKLLEYFCRNATDDLRFVVYLREQPNKHMPPPNPYYTYTVIHGRIAWLKVFISLYLFFHRDIDVYFAPAHYIPSFCPAPIVTTIHDLAYFYFPDEFLKKDFYKLKNWTREAIIASHAIIAVSKTTKKDIMEYYHTPDEKIHVVYNGFEKTASQDEKTTWEHISNKYNVKEHKYILYVGTLQPRKDIPTLIAGFALFKNDHPEFKLIIVGKKGWLFDLQAPDDSVIFTDYLPDDVVVSLYAHAFCFVLPSRYEGFGIPILEAMSYGCPVITSYASSLPEVGAEACLYFEPGNPQDLAFNINLLLIDPAQKKQIIQKGKERVKEFSWETCARETLSILKNSVK